MLKIGMARASLVAATIAVFGAAASASTASVTAQKRAIAISRLPRFQPPTGWAWGTMTNADGAHLRYGWVNSAKPLRGVIVLAPSFQAPAEEYFETARDFSRNGFAVWILDRRGQGGSDRWPGAERSAYNEGAQRESRDLRQFALEAEAHYPHIPAYLVGESFGGLIGLKVLHDSPGLFAAGVFSSPGIDFHTNGVPRALLWALTMSACGLGFSKYYAPTQHDWEFDADPGGASDPVRNDAQRALAEEGWQLTEPKLREGGATYGWVKMLFEEAAVEEGAGWPESIRTPVLFGYTPMDRIARADVIQSVCGRMPRCRLAKFAVSGHALFTDADSTRNPWMRRIESFLDQTSKARSTQ